MTTGFWRMAVPPSWIGVLVAAGAVTVLWLAFEPEPPSRPGRRDSPAGLVFRSPDADLAEGRMGARVVWSPLLFNLPSPVGFSRSAARGLSLAPPLDPPPMPLPPTSAAVSIRRAAEPAPAGFPPVPRFVPPRRLPPPPPRMQVEFPDGPAPRSAPFPVPEAACGEAAWSADVWIELDGNGEPARVFVESADAPPPVRQEIARGIRRWRGGDPAAGGSLRARIVYAGAPREERGS